MIQKAHPFLAAIFATLSMLGLTQTPVYAWQSDNGAGMFRNPVFYADYPDPDIIRVTNDFYMVSTTFADSPGINVLHSEDLVNWEIVGHCATNLNWSNLYNLVGGTAYRQGFWASSIRYYNGMFYVVANPDGANGRVYYATNAAGPWQYYPLNQGVYDPGFLIDSNGMGYIFYGYSPQQSVATLNANFSQIVSISNNVVLSGGEGSHAVRRGDYYYLFNANPGVWPYQLLCARATNIFGPWETNFVCTDEIRGGHQGAIVDLDNSGTNDYGFVMRDGGSIGRMTYLCPIVWSNNWPVWGTTNAAGYVPAVANKPVPGQTLMQPATSDEFTNSTLGLQWQWNHNPDNAKWSLTDRPGFLRLMPTQATNFWVARNTLTQKGQGPWSRGEVRLDVSHLQPGDLCGFGTLGTTNGQIAVNCDSYGDRYLSMNVIVPTTNSLGLSVSQNNDGWVPVPGTNVYLRVAMDYNSNLGTCSYSFDDTNWDTLGGQFNLAYDISIGTFQGEKYALFCYNANASTGYVDVDYFHFTDNIQRGRPFLNAARTTFVADDGERLRGTFTSVEWTPAVPAQNIANIRSLGFNAVHLYAEDFDPNYPAPGSTAPGYSVTNVDAIVAATRSNGLYLIITIGNGAYNGSYNLAWATNFWNLYAPRYADQTHVLYEIQNEPVAWGPPYSATNATPPGAINLEADCYNIIRANAPNTPVLLFSYSVFGGASGASAALTDIQAFNTEVFGNANAVWTNEAVAFHGYAGWQPATIAVSNLLSAGDPGFLTEYYGTLWGSTEGILDAQLTAQMEQLGVSWLTFEYIPPTGVSVNVTQPQNYSNIVNWAGLSWNPDYGNFPPARGTYGNRGLPWTTQDFANNALGGSLHIEAENFDTGGQGVAYYVTNTAKATVYRTNDTVDLATTTDTGGGYDVTGMVAGDWLEYTIFVSEPGLYNLKLRVAGPVSGSVQVLAGGVNGTNLTGAWTLPNTGGGQTWTTVTNTVFLTPGQQVLHLNILAGGFNLNWLELSPVTSGLVANGTWKFLNRSSALALQGVVSSGVLAAGSDTGSALQQWKLQHIGGNLYQITSVSNNWSWSANGSGSAVGFVWWWGAGGNQCFYLQPTDSGYYRFLPVLNGLSVESTPTNPSVVDALTGNGGANQQWGVVAPSAPAFPTGLSAVATSATQISLSWNAVAGATSYNVERAAASGGPYTTIATGITTTNYTDTVPAGATYYYVVSAVVNGVESLNSMQAALNLPFPWMSQDVGAVGVSGGASCSNGVFTVAGAGADIQNANDAFQFVYVTATGNCTIIARVVSVQDIDPWSKAGVMIRESLNATAANAFVAVTPGNGVTWQDRSSTGGGTAWSSTSGLSAPYWVKLVRTGNTFTGYRSPDGLNWTQQGTAAFTVASNTVYVGLAVTSHNSSTLCAATFDNVTAPNWPPSFTPTGLTATAVSTSQINLAWNALANAASYNVERSTTNGGPFAIIAPGVTVTNYSDSGLAGGTMYYYVVSAMVAGSETSNSTQAATATLSPTYGSLVHRYSFLETSGTNVADSVGGPVWTGTLPNGGTLGGGQLTLSSNAQQYVSLPPGMVNSLSNITVMAWVNYISMPAWDRLFDFGDNTTSNFYLTPYEPYGGTIQIGLTTNGAAAEEHINSDFSNLSTNVWHQIAMALSGNAGVLYVDGRPVGTNSSLTLSPLTLGSTANNYIGKSQYGTDPYINGSIDEFRIYNVGLSPAEIAATTALGPGQLLSTNNPPMTVAMTGTKPALAWPLANAGFTLQSCSNLALGGWVNVTSPAAQIVGSQWQVGLPPATNAAAFYRLVK